MEATNSSSQFCGIHEESPHVRWGRASQLTTWLSHAGKGSETIGSRPWEPAE